MFAEQKRWKAIVTVRSKDGPRACVYEFEELYELHNLVEQGPDWNSIINIEVTLQRSTGAVLVEGDRLQ